MTDICRKLHNASRNFLHSANHSGICHIDPMDMRQRIIATIEGKDDLSVRKVSLAAGMSDSALNKFLTG